MAKILFVNANLNGHINPTLPLVKELVERGNQVDYFCSKQFKEKINLTGAEFLNYSKELEEFLLFYRPTDKHPFYMLMEYILLYTEAALPFVMGLIRKKSYDMIICDSLFGGPTFLKHIIKIPVVSSHSSFAMKAAPIPPSMLEPGLHPQLDHCYEILNRLREEYRIPKLGLDEIFISKAEWNVVYTIPEFNGDVGPEPRKYLFTGAAPQKAGQELKDVINQQRLPLVYISLGSINTDFIDFYKLCMNTFKDSKYFVVMAIGNKCSREQLGSIPDNFFVGNFLPQIEILMQTDVFITHAGFNSVSEALHYAVPMYALPMVNDQHMVAKRIKDLGLGIVGSFKEVTPEILREVVEELLLQRQWKENCQRISAQFKAADHLTLVAETLERICAGE
ncbi:MAG: glycosyltransferase [Mobilitalea sp.]